MNNTVAIDQMDEKISASMEKGVLKGFCPIAGRTVMFNIGSSLGMPSSAICEELSCQYHTTP
ncbi:MAG: hypothetical protein ABSE04_02485 [Candidatus Microgenomates bacterium]